MRCRQEDSLDWPLFWCRRKSVQASLHLICHQVRQSAGSGQLNTLRALLSTVAEGRQARGMFALEVLPQANGNPSADR